MGRRSDTDSLQRRIHTFDVNKRAGGASRDKNWKRSKRSKLFYGNKRLAGAIDKIIYFIPAFTCNANAKSVCLSVVIDKTDSEIERKNKLNSY